ncbi:gluconate:H+ symporter [Flavivirga abyssicola]|uniref:GntP family permease n=1 Tax=Flavivirga abyssicola TaxID=3063533 RepID=UPI0026E09021|nr:gluconate:H+ symporter [Flavivirga sp. MEBiC07777]WVK13157.1 gluconate:H+ symporter [Flavivirga sp. MEBiC07777]
MIDFSLLTSVILGVVLLIVLILRFKIQAFLSLLIASIFVGVLSGMEPLTIIKTMQEGMGNTLGFVALVVGLGGIFGAILEHSGGAESLAASLLAKFGVERSPWALMLAGFIVAIPVFFEVAFIILVPMVYALQKKTGKPILLYGIPLLAGLAITHTFIPPTPGPVAVADILKADLGWVIFFGLIAGIPTAILCGPIFGKFISKRVQVSQIEITTETKELENLPSVGIIISIIAIPILLIVVNTILNSPLVGEHIIPKKILEWMGMIGHPFSALIIANLIAWYLLGIRRGFTKDQLLDISTKSMAPAGMIILITGAGGVFKQMLVNTGAGEMLANYFANEGVSILLFAFLSAVVIRILQGSATVAMITAAGLTAPLLMESVSDPQKALLVIAVASGASIMSHVNDSGFWLVGKYLGLSEKQTFQSWTAMTTLLAITGFACASILSLFF